MRGVRLIEEIARAGPARIGVVGGVAGLALLLVLELAVGPSAIIPVLRYTWPDRDVLGGSVAGAAAPTVAGLRSAFSGAGYDLDGVRDNGEPVPRLRLPSLPRDLPDIGDAGARKSVFLKLALPLVLEVNSRIAGQRRRLQQVARRIEAGDALSPELQRWLSGLARDYRVPEDRIDVLLRRVDVVPPSLALAQAAAESGWGTSRFALEGNAVFGQWTTAGGRGLVPLERPQGRNYKVRAFDRLIDSFSAYVMNLNTHRAYREFRARREEMRRAGKPLDGYALAGTLLAYSEQGQDYVDMLHTIMRVNELAPLDRARLGDVAIEYFDDA